MQGSPLDLSDQPGLLPLAQLVAAMHRAKPDALPLLVGAMARDVLLSFAHDIRVARATQDMDFAFAFDGWDDFADLRNALLASEAFTDVAGVAHRLIFEHRYRLDLIPFGGVERADRTMAWLSDHGVEMSMLGYREAAARAVRVRLPDQVELAVASLPAQAVLKLFAWRDRRRERPGVDAGDLRLLLRHYLDAGNEDRLYTEASHHLEMRHFDRATTSAWLLGLDARRLLLGQEGAGAVTLAALLALLAREIDLDDRLTLVTDMRSGEAPADIDLLCFLYAGLDGKPAP
jgi:predicted nucleotidyltransferase